MRIVKKITGFLVILGLLLVTGCFNKDNGFRQGYIEGRLTYVASQNTGILDILKAAKGATVKRGQDLFRLEPNPQLAQLHQAKEQLKEAIANLANLEKGKRPTEIAAIQAQQQQIIAQLNYSKKMLDRYRAIYAKRLLPKATVDQQEANYNNLKAQLHEITENLKTAKLGARSDEIQSAKAAVYAQEAAVRQAEWELQQKIVHAPINGIIYDVYYRLGETVPANHAVLSILAPQNIYAVFFEPEKKLATIKLNQSVSISCDSCQKPITGTINYISSVAEYTPPIIYSERSRSKLVFRIEAKLSLADAEKLHPGQPITVTTTKG